MTAAARPIFFDDELRNSVITTPSLTRKLMDWAAISAAKDKTYYPFDQVPDRSGRELLQDSTVDATYWKPFGLFYVPDPVGPSRRLVLWLYFSTSGGGAVDGGHPVTVQVTSNRGMTQSLTVTATGWSSYTVPAAADSMVRIEAKQSSAGLVALESVCAWWEPPTAAGATLDASGISIPSQTWAISGRPDSAAYLRAVARFANRGTARTMRMVCAKSNLTPFGVAAVGGTTLLRYKVWIGDYASQLSLKWVGSCDVGATLTVKLDGVSIHTATSFTAGSNSATVSIAAAAGRAAEVTVVLTGIGLTISLQQFCVSETAYTDPGLALPSGDTWPVALPTLTSSGVGADKVVAASGASGGRVDLLNAVLYILNNQRRALISDSHGLVDRLGGASPVPAGATGQQTWIPSAPTSGTLRVAVYGNRPDSALPATGRVEVWRFLVGVPVVDASYPISTSAPHPRVGAYYAGYEAAAGERIVDWPELLTIAYSQLSYSGFESLRFIVDNAPGAYELEFAGCCIE